MCNWLEANQYSNATPDVKRAMRKQAFLPKDVGVTVPEAYRLWRLCQDNPWWDGGMSNQPYLLMLEFAVCANAHQHTQEYLANTQRILSDGNNN